MHTGLGKWCTERKKERDCLSKRGRERERLHLWAWGTERAKVARPAFNGCLAHAHRVKTWLRHKLVTGDPEMQLNNYIPPFVYYKNLRGVEDLNGCEWSVVRSLSWLLHTDFVGVKELGYLTTSWGGWLLLYLPDSEELVGCQLGPHKMLERQKLCLEKILDPRD